MLSRFLSTIAVGAAVLIAPAAYAEPTSPVTTASVAPADNPAKPVVKKKTKKKVSQKKPAPVVEEKPKGLFASLFGGTKPEPETKPMTKAEKAKAAKEKAARAKAEKAERAAADKAAREAKLAAERAREEKQRAIEEAELTRVRTLASAAKSNSGELRSENQEPKGFFDAVFGGPAQMLPETKALDAALTIKDQKKKFKVKSDFLPQTVAFDGYKRGQIVIDTESRYLYLIESGSTARRYAIAVGRDGLQFKGKVSVGDKQEWPRWTPTKEMQQRDPAKYGQYKDGMDGGTDNPLGARAIYLYQGKSDTHLRIHGTNQPETIGTSASNGCFRMVNEHVIDLYGRVKKGTEVIVM